MNSRKVFSLLLLLAGEAIIIAAFILFRGRMTDDILVLNIVATSIIYSLFFIDILIPWIEFDKPQRRVGMLGLRWFITWIYAILAVLIMVGFYIGDVKFTTQLIVHCTLFFFLMLGMRAVVASGDQVENVYVQETKNRSGLVEMKTAMQHLKNKMAVANFLPEEFVKRINDLEENLRFISPSNNQEAFQLEQLFIETIHEIGAAISDFSMNEDKIENNLKKCEHVYHSRKQIYSN